MEKTTNNAGRERMRTEAPKNSPWGQVQTCKKIADGIWSVTTASHGGVLVDEELRVRLILPATAYSQGGWFEEDCDWAIVALSFPEFFEEKTLEAARQTMKYAYKGEYDALFSQLEGV